MPEGRGSVTVNNKNLGQGSFPEIERKLLFLGNVPPQGEAGSLAVPNLEKVISVNSQTDFDDLLGDADSELKANILAAQLNGGQNWEGWIIPMDTASDYLAMIDASMAACSPEGIIIIEPSLDEETIKSYRDKAAYINGTWGRQVFIAVATLGIDATTQTWADYELEQIELQDEIVGNRVCLIPMLHGNDIGVLAGRLCNRISSIADSPMRTLEPGPVLGLGETPVDKDGIELPDATLSNLAANRLNCIQRYPDYPGTYWGDCTMLEAPGGDWQVIEYLRPALKAARAVRILMINRIASRLLNSTPQSMESHKSYFTRPLREMSKTTRFAGYTHPGEIKPPGDDAIAMKWHSKTDFEAYLKVCPYNSPKTLTMNIVLDLSNKEQVA